MKKRYDPKDWIPIVNFIKTNFTAFQPIHQSLVLGFIERFNGWAY